MAPQAPAVIPAAGPKQRETILIVDDEPSCSRDLADPALVLQPASAGAQLAPGGRESVIFFAAGQTASPVHCSFNGTAC